MRIMLVDDDDVLNYCNKRVIDQHFGKGKVDLEIFESVDEALEYLSDSSNEIDYIFLDINLPGKNGWDFLNEYEEKQLKSLHPNTIIYVTSTSLYENDRIMSEKNDLVSKFILKPLTEEILRDNVK